MLSFQTTPPPDPRGNSLALLRCPTLRAISGIITCRKMVGCATHYYHGRTVPCDDTNCAACDDGVPWRWHGYVSLFSTQTNNHVLFEFTAKAAEPLTQYFEAYKTLRGCLMNAKRLHPTPNARVILTTKSANLEQVAIPNEPNILEALSIIWNIELPAMSIDGISKGNPALAVRKNPEIQNNRIRDALDSLDPAKQNGNGSHE